MTAEPCLLCGLVTAGSSAPVAGARPGSRLLLRLHGWPVLTLDEYAVPGWVVLASPRHVGSAAELDDGETATLGPALRTLDGTLRRLLEPRKVYVLGFGEQLPHWHLLVAAVSEAMSQVAGRGAELVGQRALLADQQSSRVVADRLAAVLSA